MQLLTAAHCDTVAIQHNGLVRIFQYICYYLFRILSGSKSRSQYDHIRKSQSLGKCLLFFIRIHQGFRKHRKDRLAVFLCRQNFYQACPHPICRLRCKNSRAAHIFTASDHKNVAKCPFMAVRSSFRQTMFQISFIIIIRRILYRLITAVRISDISDHYVSGILTSGIKNQTQFIHSKSNRRFCFHRRSKNFSRIPMNARRDINCKNAFL